MKVKKLTGETIFKAEESESGISVLEKISSNDHNICLNMIATKQKQRSDKNEKFVNIILLEQLWKSQVRNSTNLMFLT